MHKNRSKSNFNFLDLHLIKSQFQKRGLEPTLNTKHCLMGSIPTLFRQHLNAVDWKQKMTIQKILKKVQKLMENKSQDSTTALIDAISTYIEVIAVTLTLFMVF